MLTRLKLIINPPPKPKQWLWLYNSLSLAFHKYMYCRCYASWNIFYLRLLLFCKHSSNVTGYNLFVINVAPPLPGLDPVAVSVTSIFLIPSQCILVTLSLLVSLCLNLHIHDWQRIIISSILHFAPCLFGLDTARLISSVFFFCIFPNPFSAS